MKFDEPVELHGAITAFRGEYFTLSNFYPHPFIVSGHRYPTVEHYHQAQKAVDPADHDRVRDAETAAEAKTLGRTVARLPDWDDRKVAAMRRGLAAKFAPGSEPATCAGAGPAPLQHVHDVLLRRSTEFRHDSGHVGGREFSEPFVFAVAADLRCEGAEVLTIDV